VDSCWNLDYRALIIDFLTPVTGPISTEYLTNDVGCVSLEEKSGNPCLMGFLDRGKIARYDFNLYVRAHGRDTASRKKAVDTLMQAARKCIVEEPFPGAYIEMTEFPSLFNRNMSGNEEYVAGFSLVFPMRPDDIPLGYETEAATDD
jgi:hypothetical protein